MDMGVRCEIQGVHQWNSLADFPGFLHCAFRVGQRGIRISQHPADPGPIAECGNPDILPEPCRELPMLRRIVRRDRAIEMCARFCQVSNCGLGNPNKSMPQHPRSCCMLFHGQFQELRSELGYSACMKTVEVRNPKTVEHRKKQERIFWSFAGCFCLFNQLTRPKCGCFGFLRAIAPEVHEGGYKRDLQLDFFAAIVSPPRSRGAGPALIKSPPRTPAPHSKASRGRQQRMKQDQRKGGTRRRFARVHNQPTAGAGIGPESGCIFRAWRSRATFNWFG
jgi:hypothetical protein